MKFLDASIEASRQTFSEILGENKGGNPTGVCQSCRTSFGKIADCNTTLERL
jgi:hypothetical protein